MSISSCSMALRKTIRPIRPNPLIPTLVGAMILRRRIDVRRVVRPVCFDGAIEEDSGGAQSTALGGVDRQSASSNECWTVEDGYQDLHDDVYVVCVLYGRKCL